jgi:type I restriction-modification system DNA methylase subunit
MQTLAEETLEAIASKLQRRVKSLLCSQEINPKTNNVCKADMLLKGDGNIRRWVTSTDWLEAIIELPRNLFQNMGCITHVWLTKSAPRRAVA